MEKQTTENETLNAKMRNMVQPIVTLLETLEIIKDESISCEMKVKMVNMMPSLINSAKIAVTRLIN